MGALENLGRDRTKVGVITHVEELNTRMYVKLIVTPQEQGLHGSIVRMVKYCRLLQTYYSIFNENVWKIFKGKG